ncbi:RING/U-box superfamily protein [Tasmannia lanceolata]|uniref:RING/U-box superfamily protein n=1 Tax=Tasmannia lanceolata TaxID=3420 RepID=UPI004063B4AA
MSTDSVHHHSPESYNPSPGIRHSLPLVLTVILLSFFLLGFLIVYICRFVLEYVSNASWLRATGGTSPSSDGPRGLHPSIISSFPTFLYSSVKDLRQGKSDLECAVCLSEFCDDDVLRVLTVCSHVFHPECIDLWLGSHTNCPVCRRELDSGGKLTELNFPVPESGQGGNVEEESHRIYFEEEGGGGVGTELVEGGERHVADGERLARFHSTGLSVVRSREDDRFTLRVTESVLERNLSCVTFTNYSRPENIVR